MAQMPDSLAQGEDDLGHIDQLQLKSGMEMEGADTGSPAEVIHRYGILHKRGLSDRADSLSHHGRIRQ
ncbi:hypothetical protein OE88DRAFT_1668791 [Heliocybe sulcata]|uniref:Uncharacterized protein n=1 Tax=Heliocybe sulcata TaxID=5364 RepID=A0A5C3MLW1_9AGAM|nr:hypothetical protein OE88DRAFT_1668791 [Heliocybe sulcata]